MLKLYYYSKLPNELKNDKLIDELYDLTSCIEIDYPNHYSWFYNKFKNELDGNKREIIFCKEKDTVYGVVFLKKSESEKKICTIMVNEEYRKNGIGTILLEEAFKFLETKQPLITMPDYKEKCFEKIIDKYEWKLNQRIESCYSNNIELVYNGQL